MYNRYYEKIGNNEPKCIDDELPFEIPNSWSWVRLGCLASIISGVSYDKNDVCESGIRILRGGNLNDLQISIYDSDVFLPRNYYDNEKQVKINDIIIVASTGSKEVIGKAGYISTELRNTQIGAFLRIIRSLYNDIIDYIKLLFATDYYREHIRGKVLGTNINNVKAEHLTQFIVPLPPLNEQRTIVKCVSDLFTQTNNIQRNQAELEQLYDDLKKKTLDLAIRGKLVSQDPKDEPASELLKRISAEKKAQLGKKYVESYIYKGDDNCYYEKVGNNEPVLLDNLPFDIPNSWAWARLGNIGDWGAGATPPRGNQEYYYGQIPWIKTGELNNGYIYSSEEHVTEKALQNCSLRLNKIGDVLIAMYGATIGKLGIAATELTTNQACCACTPFFGIYNVYLFYLLMACKDDFIKLGAGGAQPNISREKIVNYIVPVPPSNEQSRIVKRLRVVMETIDKGEN